MNASDADKIFRPNINVAIQNYLSCETHVERNLIFPTVSTLLYQAIEDDICSDLLFHYVCVSLEFLKIKDGINIGLLFPDIVKIITIIYPNRESYVKKLTQQCIVFIHKMDAKFKN